VVDRTDLCDQLVQVQFAAGGQLNGFVKVLFFVKPRANHLDLGPVS
jgi:hypothetical protein